MSKDIKVGIFVKPPRALNEVQFAAAIDSLAKCKFEVRDPHNSLHNYTFDSPGWFVVVNGRPINAFLADVQALQSELSNYERCDAELRRANQQFSDEHCRLNARIAEQAAVLEDNERRLTNQSLTIRSFQAEHGALAQKTGSDAEAMKILARQKGDAEEIVDDLRVERARQDNVIESLRAQLTAKDALLNAAGRDLEVLRERTTGFQEEFARERNVSTGLKQRLAAFDEEATRLRTELAEERAARRVEAENAAAAIESVNANFKMADRALSCRNETIAAMEKLAATRAQEHQDEKNVLLGTITSLQKSNENLARNVTAFAIEAGKQRDALAAYRAEGCGTGKQVQVALTVHKDGTVTVDSGDAPVVLMGHVSAVGNLQMNGALSS